ncbi:hypothetical protein PFISCL1PPCAC_6045, partial [Pristionchus fissidentatus]
NINLLFLSKVMKDAKKVTSNDMFDHIRNRRLFSRKVLPLGIRGDAEAKIVVDSLVPHERRFIYEQLRRRMVDQYTESTDRVSKVTVPNEDLVSLWYVYFIPSFTIGCVSTAILIFAGEGIDRTVGHLLGLSILGSAAFGNVLSNVTNILMPKYMESMIAFIGIKRPMLSIDQWQCGGTVLIVNLAKVMGVVIGCLCGMFPLALIDSPHRWDIEHDDVGGANEELEYDMRSVNDPHEPSRRKDDESDSTVHGVSA